VWSLLFFFFIAKPNETVLRSQFQYCSSSRSAWAGGLIGMWSTVGLDAFHFAVSFFKFRLFWGSAVGVGLIHLLALSVTAPVIVIVSVTVRVCVTDVDVLAPSPRP
jgi:hypothetical protein